MIGEIEGYKRNTAVLLKKISGPAWLHPRLIVLLKFSPDLKDIDTCGDTQIIMEQMRGKERHPFTSPEQWMIKANYAITKSNWKMYLKKLFEIWEKYAKRIKLIKSEVNKFFNRSSLYAKEFDTSTTLAKRNAMMPNQKHISLASNQSAIILKETFMCFSYIIADIFWHKAGFDK